MANVLTTNSTISCPNQGKAQLSSSAKLTVNGAPVLLSNQTSSWPISGCKQTDASSGQKPCLTIVSVSAGQASKLTVGDVAVLLDSFAGTSEGTPLNTLSATAGQSKLTAS